MSLYTQNCPLFAGISEADLESMLACLSARRQNYEKLNFIFSAGEMPEAVGIILSGRVHILKEDVWGNQNLIVGPMC